MATLGIFEPELRSEALFDPLLLPDGWFDPELIDVAVSVTSQWNPPTIVQVRRKHVALARRDKRAVQPMVGGPVAFAWSPSALLQAERRRLYRPPHGRFLPVPLVLEKIPTALRRRILLYQPRRERIQDTAWITAAMLPVTIWSPTVNRPKRLRYVYQRRGQLYEPPWIGGPVAFAWRPDFISNRKLRTVMSRRTRHTDLPLAQQSVVAFIVERRQKLSFVRRGRATMPPWTQIAVQVPTWTPNIISRRTRAAFQRRGRITGPPLVGGPVAFAWLPKQLPRRLRVLSLLARRGRRADVVQPQVIVPTSVWTPQPTGKRAKLIVARKRGQRADYIAGQQIPRLQTVARRTRMYPVRRPVVQRAAVFAAQFDPVQPLFRVRRRLLSLRRGKRFDFTIVIPPPSIWRPGIVRSRWAKGFNRRRQLFGTFVVHNAARIFPVITTGETDRPEGGETDRSQTGETEDSSRGDVL